MLTLILSSLLLAGAPVNEDEPDIIMLEDGKEIACRVLFENAEKVIARARRKNKEYAVEELAEIVTIERSLRAFLDQFDQLAADDVGGMADLAQFCESRELLAEARNMWIRIITVDPENEQAWTKLGGSKGRKGWRLKVRGRFYTLDQLRDRVSDWKNALELPTAHFLLKTDLEPERALNIAIDLERAYFAFYDVLGPLLELYVFDEIPEIHIFSDSHDYPTPPTPRDAWFAYSPNTLYVLGTEGSNRYEIIGNLTYALIYNSFRRTLNKQGSIAPWSRRALAEGFGASARLNPGKARWELGVPYMPHFSAHAADDEPLSLKQVIRAGLASFDSGPHMTQYIAQSYTLMFFLIHGAEGKYRKGFGQYLLSSFVGQGGTSHFERELDVKLKDLEPEWQRYVKEVAGS